MQKRTIMACFCGKARSCEADLDPCCPGLGSGQIIVHGVAINSNQCSMHSVSPDMELSTTLSLSSLPLKQAKNPGEKLPPKVTAMCARACDKSINVVRQ